MKVLLLALLCAQPVFAAMNFKKIFAKKYNHQKNDFHTHQMKGGAMDGGGSGANFPESGAAWFYQDKKEGYISVCIKHDPNFKADYDEAKRTIKESFKTWDKYINEHKIYDQYDDNGNPIPYDKRLKILTKIKIFETCTKDIDLTFYFGVIDKKVQNVLDNMINPKAFAYRNYSDIDAINGTSKGIVYIFSPKPKQSSDGSWDLDDLQIYDWSLPNYLYAMVLHEVGHIMGVGHIENTIMQKDFKHLYMTASINDPQYSKYKNYLTKIDHENFVLLNNDDLKVTFGSLGPYGSKEEKESFKFFTGHELTGKSQVFFTWMDSEKPYYQFHINDSKNSSHNTTFTTTNFETTNLTVDFDFTYHVFKRVRKVPYSDVFNQTRYHYETDNEGNIKGLIDGTFTYKNKFPMALSLNFNLGRVWMNPTPTSSIYVEGPLSFNYIHPKTQKKMPLLYSNIRLNDWTDSDSEEP